MSVDTLCLHYHHNKSELCELGRKYDSDKSSQRDHVTDFRHCHPYTLFYDALFRKRKHEEMNIAELGVLEGGSLRMWQEYFTNATIHGFDVDLNLINRFKENYNNDRITLFPIDVTNTESIIDTFRQSNTMYDMIIEDTTHQFEDQIRVIENIYSYLKPGGILIIEDIFKSYDVHAYITRLQHILHHFQDYYFVELDHYNRNSTGWNNDKLFILVKGGAVPIFKNTHKITIITPSYRLDNIPMLKNSINFDYVDKWIIVYDGTKIKDNFKMYPTNEKIMEYVHSSNGTSGNPQRNYALTKISNPDTMLYYLDDDNLIHPSLYRLLNIIDPTKMYTFNQVNRLKGNNIMIGSIDTAMTIIPYHLCNTVQWIIDKYEADGYYIKDCYDNNKDSHIFVDNELCYYNTLTDLKYRCT
jgi:predicted O-methyltransferase YrrM